MNNLSKLFVKNISNYEHLSKKEMLEVVMFGFTELGFYKFKQAYLKAKEGVCQPQK